MNMKSADLRVLKFCISNIYNQEGIFMKKELYLVLKSSDKAFSTLEVLKKEGFNATVISTESLRHAVDYYPEEHHFFNLRHLEQKELLQSVLCLFIVDADKVDQLKQIIRDYTNGFKDIKGFMYSRDITDYEGSI